MTSTDTDLERLARHVAGVRAQEPRNITVTCARHGTRVIPTAQDELVPLCCLTPSVDVPFHFRMTFPSIKQGTRLFAEPMWDFIK